MTFKFESDQDILKYTLTLKMKLPAQGIQNLRAQLKNMKYVLRSKVKVTTPKALSYFERCHNSYSDQVAEISSQ